MNGAPTRTEPAGNLTATVGSDFISACGGPGFLRSNHRVFGRGIHYPLESARVRSRPLSGRPC